MNGRGTSMEPLASVSLGEDEHGCAVCVSKLKAVPCITIHREDFEPNISDNLREIYHSSRIRRINTDRLERSCMYGRY